MSNLCNLTMIYMRHHIQNNSVVSSQRDEVEVKSVIDGHALITEWNMEGSCYSNVVRDSIWRYDLIKFESHPKTDPEIGVLVGSDFHSVPKRIPDITERLRAGAGGMKHWQELHTEAANEIDRLRQAIKSEAQYCFHWRDECIKKGDTDRAKRHKERGLRLMSHIEPHKTN